MTKQQFDALVSWVEAKIVSMNAPEDLIDSIHEQEYLYELEALLVHAPKENENG